MNMMDEMGMDFGQWVTVPMCDRTLNAEVSGDFTFPDYQPELRRLLSVTPTVLPPAKYVGSGRAELNGTVDFLVLYVGGDGELYSVPLSSEYSVQMDSVDLNSGVMIFATPVCESVNTRVSAPRKLNLRCRLRIHVCAYGRRFPEEQIRGTVEPASVRRQMQEASCMSAAVGLSDPLSVSAELVGLGEDARVVSASAEPFLQQTQMGDGIVSASGELLMKLLVARDGGGVETVARRVPFEGVIEIPEGAQDGACRVSGTVSDLSVQVEEGRVTCDAELLLEARSMRNFPVRYTADVYSTERESRCQTEEARVPVALRCENGNVSQSERIALSNLNLPERCTIVDAWGVAMTDGCEMVGGRYVLTGQSRYTLLCEKDGEYSVSEVTIPLRYETEGAGEKPVCFDAMANVISCRARIDGEMLCLDAEVAMVCDFVGERTISPVSEVEFGEPIERRGGRMTVYYPADGESDWAVAKQYHVDAVSLTKKKGACAYYFF